jgi:hypothetical protein
MKTSTILGKVLLSLIMGLVCSVLLTGCKSEAVSWHNAKDPFAKKDAKKASEPKLAVPERMVVIWKDAVYEHPALAATRGIGGRVYFYDKEDNPVKVDGEMVVYGFDDTEGGSKTEADKKFVFKQENLASHYNATAMGPSYSIWLPWDKLGGKELSVSLIPAFRDKSGKVVRSGQTICVLPGPDTEELKETAKEKSNEEQQIASFTAIPGVQKIASSADLNQANGHQTIAHLSETTNGSEQSRSGTRIRSTTISLPPDTAMRLQQASRGLSLPLAPAPANGQPAAAPSASLGGTNSQASEQPMTSQFSGSGTVLGAPMSESKAPNREATRGVFGLPGSLK